MALCGVVFLTAFAWREVPSLSAEDGLQPKLPDPHQITEANFISTVNRLEIDFGGSSGYSLGEREISWLLQAEADLKLRGIQVLGETKRLRMIASSYLNHREYGRAFDFFSRVGDACGIEMSVWLLGHIHLTPPYTVLAQEYPGPIPPCNSEETRLETPHYRFVAYLKGPVYRYDKTLNTHSILWVSDDRQIWGKVFLWSDPWIEWGLNDGRRCRFHTQTHQLETETE